MVLTAAHNVLAMFKKQKVKRIPFSPGATGAESGPYGIITIDRVIFAS